MASPASSGFSSPYSTVISTPGAFTIPDVHRLSFYWLRAYRDVDGDGEPGPCEARGDYAGNPIYLTNNVTGISITLSNDTNAPALSAVPADAIVRHGTIPSAPIVTAHDDFEGAVAVSFNEITNDAPEYALFTGSNAQGMNGFVLTGFSNALAGYGSISHESFSGFGTSPPSYTALTTTLEGVTCVIRHRDDNGTLTGTIRHFDVENPVSQGGATGAGAGIDENSGSTTNRNMFVFTFDAPVGFVGVDAIDLESGSAGTLATLRAYDATSNLLVSTNIVYPNNENGDGQVHFIGLTSDKANISIFTLTVGSATTNANGNHQAFDNLRFGTAAAADFQILRSWTATDQCGNAVSATQRIAVVETTAPAMPEFPDFKAEPELWINEIHYDNAGVDTNEGVEIAGVAGTGLSDYQLAFYSAANGKVYKTVPLSGAISSQQCGYGTAWFDIPRIQNGTGGVALVQGGVSPRHFVSYRGQITASNGPALGLTSELLPVYETSTTPLGHSLQLIGTGATYEAFAWISPMDATPGEVNTAQEFPCPPAGHVPRSLGNVAASIHIIGINLVSNAMEVTVASTNGTGTIPIDLFSVDTTAFRGMGSVWSLAATNLALAGTNRLAFLDTGQMGRGPITSASRRFYAAARAGVDADADGLSDSHELLLYNSNPNLEDTDGDGMPDGWEVAHGLNPTNPLDAGLDADGDGLTNAEEHQAGTDPQNAEDGAAMRENARRRIIMHWKLIYPTPLAFTNAPDSVADLEDMRQALYQLSNKFFKPVSAEE